MKKKELSPYEVLNFAKSKLQYGDKRAIADKAKCSYSHVCNVFNHEVDDAWTQAELKTLVIAYRYMNDKMKKTTVIKIEEA